MNTKMCLVTEINKDIGVHSTSITSPPMWGCNRSIFFPAGFEVICLRCAATADLVKVSESSYPMCSVCNQTKEPIKEGSELSHLFHGCPFLHCNDMSFFEERVLFCACVIFAYLHAY